MEARTNESPMDFQWERPSGPGDPSSPFSTTALERAVQEGARKRAQAAFQNSPTKAPPLFATPARPSLFATPSKPAIGTPAFTPAFHNPVFQTPRFNNARGDIFSTPDTEPPSSPEHDAMEETPEPLSKTQPRPMSAGKGILTTTTDRVTGRGEIRRGKVGDAKRILKRRSKGAISLEHDFWSTPGASHRRSHNEYGDESDEDDDESDESANHAHGAPPPPRNISTRKTKWDTDLPVLFSSYLQLFFNMAVILTVLYIIYGFLRTVQADVDQKVEQHSARLVHEIENCQQLYLQNRCAPDLRVPRMEEDCNSWERCMNQDPSQVGRARVSAQTFAEIINSLIEPISYKAMIFCCLLVFGSLGITNTAFGMYRAKIANTPQPQYTMPPTPMHHPPAWGHPNQWGAYPPPTPSAASLYGIAPQTPLKRIGRR